MDFLAFGDFVRYLESIGELKRVGTLIDPAFEVTGLAARGVREQRPAMLFDRAKGSAFPLAVNAYASERRIELALGAHPQERGEELLRFADRLSTSSIRFLKDSRGVLRRFIALKSRVSMRGVGHEVRERPDLNLLPVQTCWPQDGGRFITQAQVFTSDPLSGRRNVGMYRMQVFDATTTGMHWQIQKGGGLHYHTAEQTGRELHVAVVLGSDPATMLATVAALPEGIDEMMFAGFLKNRRSHLAAGRFVAPLVPAHAEFVLEGVVKPNERRQEGPFGDHFGHYSASAPFPVFRLRTMSRRRLPIYPAAVVGVPPMEDKFLGDATQQILGPLLRVLHPEIRDMWAYYEGGFHNLLVVAVEERYAKEAMKTALGLLGLGQLSLTKCLLLVPSDVDPRRWNQVLAAIRSNFDPHHDFLLLPKVPLDTLDFTSYTMELGSKMVLDATRKSDRERRSITKRSNDSSTETLPSVTDMRRIDRRIVRTRCVDETLLLVQVREGGRGVLEKLLHDRRLSRMKIIAMVSDDVDLSSQENYLWGIFTRFDCERDILFSRQRLIGISPVYGGPMGIDATWKRGYPDRLVNDPGAERRVETLWNDLWKDA